MLFFSILLYHVLISTSGLCPLIKDVSKSLNKVVCEDEVFVIDENDFNLLVHACIKLQQNVSQKCETHWGCVVVVLLLTQIDHLHK